MTTERYTFQAVGASDVVSAYRSIQRESVRTATAVERTESRSGARRTRASKSTEEKRWKEVEQYSKKIQREFDKEARAEERAQAKRVRVAEAANRRIARDRARTLSRVGAGVMDVGRAGLGVAGAAVGVVGVAARQELSLNKRINQIRANARLAGEKDPGTDALRKRFGALAMSTPGISADDAAGATEAFQSKTGQVLDADRLKVLGNIASATGADMADLASAAAALQRSFGISTLDDFTESLAGLAEQGARGAFEIKDMASLMDRMAAAAQGKFAGGTEGVRQLGGLMQLARTTTGSSEEAATVIENMMMQMVAKSGDLEKMGVDVFTDDTKTKMRDPMEVIKDFLKESGGDISQQAEIFAIRGQRGVNPLGQTYANAFKSATGTEEEKTAAALAAVDKQFEEFASTVGGYSLIQDIAADQQASASAQLTQAWEQIRNETASKLLPQLLEIAKHAPAFAAALEPAIGALGVFAEGIGVAVKALQDMGLLKKKEVNHAEEAQKLREELGLVDASLTDRDRKNANWFGQLGFGLTDGAGALAGAVKPSEEYLRRAELLGKLESHESKASMSGSELLYAENALAQGPHAALRAYVEAADVGRSEKDLAHDLDMLQQQLGGTYMGASKLVLPDIQKQLGGEENATQIAIREGLANRASSPDHNLEGASRAFAAGIENSAFGFERSVMKAAEAMAKAAERNASIVAAEP